MTLQIISVITMLILVIAVIRIMLSFMIKKKISIKNEEQFKKEIDELKHFENQVLFLFANGYWEIKEAVVSKEWSAQGGTQTIIDIDSDIDARRYKKLMGEALEKDEYGEHGIKIIKEIDLSKDHDPEHLLALKI